MANEHYQYQLRTTDDRTIRGSIVAASYTTAVERLRDMYPGSVLLELGVQVERKRGGDDILAFLSPPSLQIKERLVFTEQLAVMIKAGITLPQALRGQAEEAVRAPVRVLITDVATQLEAGTPFSEALAKYPKTFSGVFVGMIRSAEQSGSLAEVLMALTEQQRRDYELRRKVKGALTYPILISVLLVAVIALVVMFVVPRLTGLFEQSGTALPATTQFLIWLSHFLTNQWYVVIGILVGAVALVQWWYKTEAGKLAIDGFLLKIPVIGTFIRKAAIARFAQAFAFLAKAGVPVVEIFTTLGSVMGNIHYTHAVERVAKDVQNGVPLSGAIRKEKLFPGMVVQLARAGEQSGDLAGMMKVLSTFFEGEVDAMAKNLSTLLEPMIMVVMGAAIGFVLISVLQPIYALMGSIG
jgi:type IV pilus assembly protein PilC